MRQVPSGDPAGMPDMGGEPVTGQRRMMKLNLADFDYFTVGEIVGNDVVLRLDNDETTVRSKLWVQLWSRVVR